MFRGVATLNLDNKNRLAVPAKYRDFLIHHAAGKLVITAEPSGCLLIYPYPDWEPIQEKLMSLPSFNRQARALQRLIVGYAEDVEIDGAGRVLISNSLREFAGLNKRVVLVGQGKKFELWNEEKWQAQRDIALALPEERDLPPEMENFSL